MSDVMSMPADTVKTPHGAECVRADTRPTPGTWEDNVLTFAGCYQIEEQARRDMREETRTRTVRLPDQDVMRDHVDEIITVDSVVETFLEGYLKVHPDYSLATVLFYTLQARLRAVEGKAG